MNTPTQPPPREALPSDLPDLETSRDTIRKADETLLMDFARLFPHAPLPPPPDWPAKYPWPAPPLAALFADLGGIGGTGAPPAAMRSVLVTLSVRADVACMIADAKAALHPADYASALTPPDPVRLMALLTDLPAEERVLRRVADHARAHHPDLPPALVEHLWRTHIIPWTKQVELQHLLHPQPHPSPMSPQSPSAPIHLPPPFPSAALPEPIETAWLALARTETRTIADRDALHRLIPDITRLADRFTTARPSPASGAAPYLRTTREALAYTLYFAPQTYARTTQILQALPLFPTASPPSPIRLLSLGAGTGADLLAVLDWVSGSGGAGGPPAAIRATAQDHSRAALRLLRDVFAALRPSRWPAATLRTDPTPLDDPDAPLPSSSFDIVTLHYVLNELPPSSRRRVLSSAARAVAPGGWLILCDPLLRTEGDYLRDLRAWAIENLAPLTLLAPCPHTGPCPLPEPCHSVRSWTIPQTLQILSTALHRDLRRLDYAFLAFRRPSPSDPTPLLPSRPAWTVASAHDLKGRTEVPACLPDGTTSTLRLLHRHCDAPTKKRLRHLDRGTPILLPPPAL